MKFKNLLAVATILTSTVIYAKSTLTDYAALIATLREGDTVHAVIDVDKCKYISGSNTWEEKTRGFLIDQVYERTSTEMANGKKMRLIAASTHDYVGSVRDGAYISRSLLRVFENGNVEVIDQKFSMETATFSNESILACHLSSDGSGGVTLTSK